MTVPTSLRESWRFAVVAVAAVIGCHSPTTKSHDDLTPVVDLRAIADLTPLADLHPPDDLSVPDLSVPAPDLTFVAGADLTSVDDLTPPDDLIPPDDLVPPSDLTPIVVPPAAVWWSTGGGSASGAALKGNFSIGAQWVGGRTAAPSGAVMTSGYFSSSNL